jgi:DNA-binding GntR family transcriptional regulator
MPEAALTEAPLESKRGIAKSTRVYEELRAAIIGLVRPPGSQIDKTEICERMGVSRQPVSEAVARLADEGLIDIEPQKGTFVSRIRLSDVNQAAFVRRALEVAAAAAAAENVSSDFEKTLERSLAYQDASLKAKDWEVFYALDVRFHAALAELLKMPRLRTAIDAARAPLERARRLLLPSSPRTQDTVREHRAIVAALAAHDAAAASAAMGRHLDRALDEIVRFASRKPELFEA